jgi:protein phosphatase
LGGHEAGQQAAQIAVDSVAELDEALRGANGVSRSELRRAMRTAFLTANQRIREFGTRAGIESLGTTLVMTVVLDGRYVVANTGDSRCYFVNAHDAWALTRDHSYVQDLVARGSMTPEAARNSPYRHQLTECLGGDEEPKIDFYPSGELFGLMDEACALLLCSDGVHSSVAAEEMGTILRAAADLQRGCNALVDQALANGSTDNATVAAIEVGDLHVLERRPRWFRSPWLSLRRWSPVTVRSKEETG